MAKPVTLEEQHLELKSTTPRAVDVVLDIPIDDISPDPNQPRKDFDPVQLRELQESIKADGLLEPIMVRPLKAAGQVVPGKYVAIFGERRLRAMSALDRPTIRATVRDADEAEVLRIQLAENDRRAALNHLERSSAHQQMRARGQTIEQIAKETSTSAATVRDSLKLQELASVVKKAWVDGKLDYSDALEFAKLPTKVQPDALTGALELMEDAADDDRKVSVRGLRAYLRREFMLELKKALFPIADAQLVAAAGACTTCPKRTGAQPELFAHLKDEPDVCTDKPCHTAKGEAYLAQAEKLGRRILNEGTAKQIFDQYSQRDTLNWNAGYVLADEKPYGAKKAYGDQVDPKDVALVVNPATGSMLKVVSKSALPKPKAAEVTRYKKSPAEVKREREHEVRLAAARAARPVLLERVKKAGTDTHWLRVVLLALCRGARSEPLKNVVKWRDLDAIPGESAEAIIALGNKLAGPELRALVFEFAIAERSEPYMHAGEHAEVMTEACAQLGVDLKKLEKEAANDIATRAHGKKATKKARAA